MDSDRAAVGGEGMERRSEEEEGGKLAPVSFRLFGKDVHVVAGEDVDDEGKLRKSSSMQNLAATDPLLTPAEAGRLGKRFASDDCALASREQKRRRRKAQERKKGIPWTEEEHRKFLDGLRQLGKGDWRGISKSFVVSRTATQVASHAQKYFLRQTNPGKKKRRASLFDVGIADYNREQVPSPRYIATKPAPVQEIIHTDRGDVPVPSYRGGGGILGNKMQVDELSNYFKRSRTHAETSHASMGSGLETASSINSLQLGIAVSSLELSIAPPRACCCATGAIKVL
ncbi:hypothetical protein ACP4OV_002945 [Aristida adscensionis]